MLFKYLLLDTKNVQSKILDELNYIKKRDLIYLHLQDNSRQKNCSYPTHRPF